jgi:RimJ/RimL family protein N-acetyltransferase
MMFKTARMTVRHFTDGDLEDFAALCANPDVMRLMGDGTILPRAEVERWIGVCHQKYATRGYGTSAVFETATGKFMGYCGVVRAPDRDFDELIYAFLPAYWGQGYATEAGRAMLNYVFALSTLDTIYETIDSRHGASIHVAEKLGMVYVASEPEDDGTTTLIYALQRADFATKRD